MSIENETKNDKFVRIAETRVNKVLGAVERLQALSNRSSYEYTQEDVDMMFGVIENKVEEIKAAFKPKIVGKSAVFSFGKNGGIANE